MVDNGEPKSTDFLLSHPKQNQTPSIIQNKLTVRSGEARQESQIGGVNFNPTFYHSLRMSLLPTKEESYFEAKFKEKIIYKHFEIQKPIRTEFTTYIVDFCIEKQKIIVEIDGLYHLTKLNYDIKRDNALRNLGYTILHFTNEEIKNNINRCFSIINNIIKLKMFKKHIYSKIDQAHRFILERNLLSTQQAMIKNNYLRYINNIQKEIDLYMSKLINKHSVNLSKFLNKYKNLKINKIRAIKIFILGKFFEETD